MFEPVGLHPLDTDARDGASRRALNQALVLLAATVSGEPKSVNTRATVSAASPPTTTSFTELIRSARPEEAEQERAEDDLRSEHQQGCRGDRRALLRRLPKPRPIQSMVITARITRPANAIDVPSVSPCSSRHERARGQTTGRALAWKSSHKHARRAQDQPAGLR